MQPYNTLVGSVWLSSFRGLEQFIYLPPTQRGGDGGGGLMAKSCLTLATNQCGARIREQKQNTF